MAFSCSFASHNLNEVLDAATKVLETPNVDIKSLLKIVHGPDFPTGAQIINKDELITAYTTGKGRIRVRAEYNIEKNKNQTTTIAFTSIPYKVSKEKLAIDIDKLCEAGTITGVIAIRDESNQEGVRFVVELDKNTNPEAVVKKLFKHTALEDIFNINQVALVDKKPKLLNLKELLEIYVNHQRDVLLRKTKFDLDKIEARIHILEGLLIALEDIDNVIKLIKESESAVAAKISLINKYSLSEAQAKAILDMKLSRLAKLEKVEIQQEKEKLLIEKSNLKAIIENPTPELKRIFEELKNKYGDVRRTKITQIDDEESVEDIPVIPKEKCVVLLSEDGKIKRTAAKNYRPQKRNGKGLKNKEDAPAQAISTDTHDELLVFTNAGKVLLQRVSNLDDNYSYLSKDKISFIYSLGINKGNTVIFATKNGLIKKVSDIKSLIPARFGRETSVISLKDDDELIRVSSLSDDENVIIITQNGKAIKFKNEEVPEYATKTAAGVKGIALDKDDYVVSVELANNNENMLGIFLSNGTGKKINLKDFVTQKRGGKGVSLLKTNSKSKIVNTCILNNEDSVLICGKNTSICLTSEEIPLGNRATETKLLIKDSEVISVYKI